MWEAWTVSWFWPSLVHRWCEHLGSEIPHRKSLSAFQIKWNKQFFKKRTLEAVLKWSWCQIGFHKYHTVAAYHLVSSPKPYLGVWVHDIVSVTGTLIFNSDIINSELPLNSSDFVIVIFCVKYTLKKKKENTDLPIKVFWVKGKSALSRHSLIWIWSSWN